MSLLERHIELLPQTDSSDNYYCIEFEVHADGDEKIYTYVVTDQQQFDAVVKESDDGTYTLPSLEAYDEFHQAVEAVPGTEINLENSKFTGDSV